MKNASRVARRFVSGAESARALHSLLLSKLLSSLISEIREAGAGEISWDIFIKTRP